MGEIFTILLVEDNTLDVRLTQDALTRSKLVHNLQVVGDGIEAMAYLHAAPPYSHSPRPDLILMDLNLPLKDGREVLAEVKADPDLHSIPVVILTDSTLDEDIIDTYELHANGYIIKPVAIEQFYATIRKIKEFWMSVVVLPSKTMK
jgi:chemotaxis family two-component system response regulator Rcp1